MNILAIGLGGAGGRIVDMLYRIDRRSSKVVCVEALAVDVDGDALNQLTGLPKTSKIYFSPLQMEEHRELQDSEATTFVDITEVAARVQTMATGETDAIFICIGLGGSFAGVASRLITSLRQSITEPIFGLFTLPCRSEGERCSANAAEGIEILSPLLDGIIIFDNETWYKKIKARQKTMARDERKIFDLFKLRRKKEEVLSPAQRIYLLLNDAIVRRISLILRAGEFKADGGLELAEVVLDSGEVLNTIRGMGFITIGYAVEQLPSNPLNFLKKWRPGGYFFDEHHKKASRIVELAKQAIYHEISAPCDITSAHKALVLIAGPSHELSMKGYLTVRKWIDRSIAGLETRSGDYPVVSTRFVAIIIMLSGLQNIPRIEEIKEIGAQYKAHEAEGGQKEDESGVPGLIMHDYERAQIQTPDGLTASAGEGGIILPPKKVPQAVTGVSVSSEVSALQAVKPLWQADAGEVSSVEKPDRMIDGTAVPEHSSKQVIITKQQKPKETKDMRRAMDRGNAPLIKKAVSLRQSIQKKEGQSSVDVDSLSMKDRERQRIERELHRQRHMAIHGTAGDPDHNKKVRSISAPSHQSSHQLPHSPDQVSREDLSRIHKTTHKILKQQEAKTVVLHKKGAGISGKPSVESLLSQANAPKRRPHVQEQQTDTAALQPPGDNTLDSWLRQATTHGKRADAPKHENITLKEAQRTARDGALLHTDLKRETSSVPLAEDAIRGIKAVEQPREIEPSTKKLERKRTDNGDI